MHKIWVADDDTAIRMVLEESLSSAGFLTSMFPDADSLLEQLKVDKPDLIITDVKMPGSHGYDLLKHINDNFEQIPVIIMTAFTDMQAAVDSYGGGAFEYMPKPFDLDEAMEIVNRALEGKPITKGLKVKFSSEIIGKASTM
jgi:two-component system nitrogen regulation response regulator GlnG